MNRNGPSSLLVIIIICPVDMIVYARFDEILSITQDIKKKRYGRTDNMKTVYPPTNTVCGGYNHVSKFSSPDLMCCVKNVRVLRPTIS